MASGPATDGSRTEAPLLRVRDLHTYFDTNEGIVKAVDGVDFDVRRGETVAIVGESGSGKTVTSESITKLYKSPPGYIPKGTVEFDGVDLTELEGEALSKYRGRRISHIFQNPQGALNPVYTVGWQLKEALALHRDLSSEEIQEEAVRLFTRVGIPEASTRLGDYPHEFSGGMKQRVMIAMALAAEPDLLIADEPTTALDVTIQAQILRLLNEIKEERNMSIIFITHDLGVVAEVADRVVVMYAGKVMERAGIHELFETPAHPYTRALLECLPGRGGSSGIPGDLPSPVEPPPGCRFHERCEYAIEDCRVGDQPPMHNIAAEGEQDHLVSCVHYGPGGDPSVVTDDHLTTTESTSRRQYGDAAGGDDR